MAKTAKAKQIRDALAELVEFIKIHKTGVLYSMTRRETEGLMKVMHQANLALSNEPSGMVPVYGSGEKE